MVEASFSSPSLSGSGGDVRVDVSVDLCVDEPVGRGKDHRRQPSAADGTEGMLLPVRPMSVVFHGINSFVPGRTFPTGGSKGRDAGDSAAATKKRRVLVDVSGGVSPGEVLALMGPSGSGKTLLLAVLGGRFSEEVDVEGEVLYNGNMAGGNLKRQLGFVPQDDLMFGTLTVWETLWYTARLRLPGDMPTAERQRRVRSVISTLGLDRCRDTIIGGLANGRFVRGVSGGERKRVSVGHEMLINPALLFLDEPTSGLDATTALALVHTLHDLARAGRTIVTTIHQPSSRMFQQLDKLLLLSQGRTVYYGGAMDAAPWLEGLGVPCPFAVNLADHILDCASGNFGMAEPEENEKLRAKLLDAYTSFQQGDSRFDAMTGYVPPRHPANDAGADESDGQQPAPSKRISSSMSKTSSAAIRLAAGRSIVVAPPAAVRPDGAEEPRWATGWTNQVSVLITRNFKVNRFERVNAQSISQVVFVSLVVGLLWFQLSKEDTVQAASDTTGVIFFQILFFVLSGMFSALFVFPSQLQYLRKERASGMYRLSAYYTAKMLSDMPLDLALPTLGVIIIYFMAGLRLVPWWAFFANWSTILLLLLTGQGYGLILGTAFGNIKTAQTVATVTIMMLMLLGGFYVTNIPYWISWVKYVSFIYYGYNILLHIEFSARTFVSCTSDGTGCVPVDIQQTLGLAKDPNASVALDIGVMCLMMVSFRIILYFVLGAKTKAPKQ